MTETSLRRTLTFELHQNMDEFDRKKNSKYSPIHKISPLYFPLPYTNVKILNLFSIYQGVHITYSKNALSLTIAQHSLVDFQPAYKMKSRPSILAGPSD